MSNFAQKGIVHILALLLLAGGLIAGILFAFSSNEFRDNVLGKSTKNKETKQSSPTPSPTPVHDHNVNSTPSPAVSTSSGIYGGAVTGAGALGTCSEAIHDKYVVKGPDGGTYRTWHPQKDSSGCTFAHEHGENPANSKANNTMPPFGYIGKLSNHDIEAHGGFKVSVVNEGDTNDEGSVARYSTRVVFHMGTGGVKRYVVPHHSLMFDLVGQGKQVHVLGMADTGGIGSICANPRLGRTVMQLDCQPDSPYEIWEGKLNIAGKVSVTMSMAQFDPITTRDPSDNTKLIYTKDIVNKFGSPWGEMHGCDRETYHSPVNFQTSGDGSIQTIYTDASGNPVASGTGFKQIFSNSSGEVFGSSLIMTYKDGQPMTQMKMHKTQCASGLGLSN
jgi:hypothetical protein